MNELDLFIVIMKKKCYIKKKKNLGILKKQKVNRKEHNNKTTTIPTTSVSPKLFSPYLTKPKERMPSIDKWKEKKKDLPILHLHHHTKF